ncbi:IS110 family transposase [Paenibacillus sp. WC2504]|uniref:IS110 family transposase n=1 Tax=Paenibacillus sp. WC2504 TaxID=3461403 RepID=UPI0040457982
MNPVIGVDVSKGESHAQAFLDRGVPHGKIFRFNHDLEGLASFLSYIKSVESVAGIRPTIVMEATGHYQSPVVQFLDEHQYLNIVINPLISHNAKKTNLRRLKTDAADAHLLGTLFYKEEFEPYKKRGQHLMNLRFLTRQYEALTGMYAQAKLQFQAILDQVFPEYHGVFGDLYSKVSLRFLALHPTSKEVLEMSELEITTAIQSLTGRGKSVSWCLAEIGEIDRFDHAKKLVAFAGVDPSVFSSGKFVATQNKITKHGSRRLRTALYQAVRCGIRSNRNKKLRTYYDKKRAEGKLFKVAVIACVNKLIHWIFAILTTKEAFRLE